MNESLRPVALITGASAGIGVALARVFAQHGHRLALVARREDRLQALADEIAGKGPRRPIVIPKDLRQPGASERIRGALAEHGAEPEYVVNNAGFGLAGPAARRDRGEQLAMIDVNIRALTDLSLAFVDSLARHRGGILNIGSMAGFLPGPGMAVYYASKAYVLSFSEALHSELKPHGVRVTVVCPGPVPTEFAERAGGEEFARPRPAHADARSGCATRLPRADARRARRRPRSCQPARGARHQGHAASRAAACHRRPPAPPNRHAEPVMQLQNSDSRTTQVWRARRAEPC
jgi:short-subunit dehydrogenase